MKKKVNLRKTRTNRGGSLKSIWASVLNKLKFKKSKDDVKYIVSRNADNTADKFSVEKNGVVIMHKEVPDNKLPDIFKSGFNNMKHFFTMYKNGLVDKTDTNDNTDKHKMGGAEKLPPPTSFDIGENTTTYNYIYKRRGFIDMFGRALLHLILIFLFGLFYLLFVVAYIFIKKDIPLNFYKKYIVMKDGSEVEVK